MEDKIKALAKYLGVDSDEISDDYGDNVYTVNNAEEYYVLTDEEANDVAEEYIKMSIDDLGFKNAFTKSFFDYCIDHCGDEEKVNNFIEQEIEYFTEQEPDAERVDYLENLSDSDRINYIRDLLGDDEIDEFLDIDKITDQAIDWDGRAHFLASYDGEEIDLGNDLYAYRIF